MGKSKQRKRRLETKLMSIILRDMYNEQKAQLDYLCRAVAQDLYRRGGWNISLQHLYNKDNNTVAFAATRITDAADVTRELGEIPLKDFQILAPAQHERMISTLIAKVTTSFIV